MDEQDESINLNEKATLELNSSDAKTSKLDLEIHSDFFHLDARYFPTGTKNLFDLKTIVQYGILPLGLKTTYQFFFRARSRVNVGLLRPDKESLAELEGQIRAKIGPSYGGLKAFWVHSDEFLNVLESVYCVKESVLVKEYAPHIHPLLASLLKEA